MYVKGRPCSIAHGKGQPTGPSEEVPNWTFFPNSASKISSRHTIGGFYGQLCSRPRVYQEVIVTNQGYPGQAKTVVPGYLSVVYCLVYRRNLGEFLDSSLMSV